MTHESHTTPPNCTTPERKTYPAQRASLLSAGRFRKALEHPLNTPQKPTGRRQIVRALFKI